MRCLGFVAAAFFALVANAALAQGWHEFMSREEFFLVGMPGEPEITDGEYRAASGAVLPTKIFTASDMGTTYTVTVVHYMNATQADVDAALEHEVERFRARPGEVTYDAAQEMEGLPGHMIYLLNPDQSRTAAGIFMHAGPSEHGGPGRLYILEATAAAGRPPAIQFPQSFFPIDAYGERLSYDTNENGERIRIIRSATPPNAGEAYNARNPATCETRSEPRAGAPTVAQAAELLRCTAEGIADGSLFLLEELELKEVGAGETLDARYYPDLGEGEQAYPIAGSLVRYECRRENDDNRGANCRRDDEPNASGYCYRMHSGDWNCRMSDLALTSTMGVPAPGRE